MAVNRRKKPRNTTAQPGYWAAKHALAKFGAHVIDGRSRVAHALDQFRDGLIADLGGAEAVSQQQRVIVDLSVRTYLMVSSLDNYLLSLGSLVNRRKGMLWPVVRERVALADSLARYMSMLGLERKQKPLPSLAEVLRQHEEEKSAATTTTNEETAAPPADKEAAE
jgi:hypothetical protein